MAVAELWETLKHAIEAYTGLSPATFFTVLAVAVAFYYAVAGLFRQPPPPPTMRKREADLDGLEPLPPPVQLGEITEEELKAYDGTDPNKPLLMAIKGQIYDVTQSRVFYGPGGPYALFSGRDASRALAKMSFDPEDLTGDISGLGPFEVEALQDWEYKFMSKYVKVGTIKKAISVSEGSNTSAYERKEAAAQTTERDIQIVNDASQTNEYEQADLDAEIECSAELEEDGAQGHDDEAKHTMHLKDNVPSSTQGEEGHDDEAEHTSQVKDDAQGHDDEAKHTTQLKENLPSSTQGEEAGHAT